MRKHTFFLIILTACSLSCKTNNDNTNAVKEILSDAITAGLDKEPDAIAGMASISQVGSPDSPISVLFSKKEGRTDYSDYSYESRRAPVFPSSIMQTATLAYYIDKGIITVNDSVITNHGILPELENESDCEHYDPHIMDYERETGREKMSIRAGFLRSLRYVTRRYVLDNMDATYYYNNLFVGYVDQLTDYFGPSVF